MDLADFDTVTLADEGIPLVMLHPESREPLKGADDEPVVWTIAGFDSDRLRKVQRNATNARLKGNRLGQMTAEEAEKEAADLIVACVLGWSGNWTFGGEALSCTAANVRKVFAKVPAFRDQVAACAGDRARFLATSRPS